MRLLSLLSGFAIALGFVFAAVARPIPADSGTAAAYDYKTALSTSQAAIGNQLGDYPLLDGEGKTLNFAAFRGKPLVLSLVYTSCYQICPMTTRHLAKVVSKARYALGAESFNVATMGFDATADSPEAMRYFALQQGIADQDWQLLSIAPEDVDALKRDLGFTFFPSTAGFDHVIQATVVDAEGQVYRQVYGQVFDTPLLVEPLKDLILGRPRQAQTFISDLVNKVRFFCTTYDPARDGYYFDYSLFIGMLIGGLIIGSVGVFLIREILHRWRHPGA